ncbi:MAG: nucleoid-associated protein [Candidatus Tenebribacter burtonii]|jgi:hypothetical protein|nr:nucleoid-associated protein [Candidatus Tenebribacter burtonii]
MIDYTNCNIKQVSVHNIGNKTNGEGLHLSRTMLDISDTRLRELLIKFFLKSFKDVEFYNFSFSNDDFKLNPIFNFASNIFYDSNSFHLNSVNIAKHLFETSIHPNIKSGDLFITKFSDIQIDEELLEVIGIFKSENRQPFLKLNSETEDFVLKYDDGINIDKLDKGCLIFNISKTDGFKVCIVDKSNKSFEAQYWKDIFLQLQSCNDNFHNTKELLNITKSYISKQVSEDFDISKTDKIDLLNRSLVYFENHDSYNREEFETKVFQNKNMLESFQNYNNAYKTKNKIYIDDDFEISSQAVRKQARAFKSVLKLDKNFHIYIHGNKDLIEQGVESDGRKYYKIYYDKEQ